MKLKTQSKLKFKDFNKSYTTNLNISNRKFLPLYLVIVFIFSLLLYNLFSTQIVDGSEYLSASNLNYKSRDILRAPRGVIYDINDIEIASNEQAYSVYIDIYEFDIEQSGLELSQILSVDESFIQDKIDGDEVFAGRITLKSGFEHDEYLSMVNKLAQIPGVYSASETKRQYLDSNIYAHIVGYLGDASPEDLGEKVDEFSRVGKTGIESVFDDQLRGRDGVIVQETDINSGETKNYIPNTAEPGDNIILNINSDWQRTAYLSLADKVNATGGQGGAMTIVDIETGDVKVMASYPTFDLYKFTEGISVSEFEELLKDSRTPLMERNIGVAIPTGSIFKVLTGLIILEEDAIEEDTTFYSDGCMELPGEGELCESFFRRLGNIDIYDAISESSNIFFCESMRELDQKSGGIQTYINYTDQFGIGKFTGVDLPYESAGSMATPDVKWDLFQEPWYIGDSCNTSIGQGFLSATPIQMAMALAAMDNGGEVLKPNVVNRIEDNSGNILKVYEKQVTNTIDVSEENLDIIKEGMRQAVESGTATSLSGIGDSIIAKTGTATASVTISGKTYTEPHAWVMGIFEHEGRKYAFVVNIAHGGWGSQATEVAQRVLSDITQ